MKLILAFLLIGLISGQEEYDKLINEKVDEQYCKDVIGNMTSIIRDGYIFLDFVKSPIQPDGYEDYFPSVDLIKELNDIDTKNRKFYDFYRDIQNILEKTRDGHFSIYAQKTPNKFELSSSYFCIPFHYYINEIFDEKNEVNDTYLSIEPIDSCKEEFSEEILKKINDLKGKRIITINNLEPYEHLEEMGKKGMVVHGPQARYIILSWYISSFYLHRHPFKKEELNLSIKFEGIDEEFKINYQFKQKQFFSSEFKEYFLAEQEKYFKLNLPFPTFEEIELKYKIKKGLIHETTKNEEKDIWDLKSKDGLIKCKVDNDKKFNVFYQNSFSPEDFDDYENVMYKCFDKFYSNDYKIIVIEDQNGGGYSELCIPFTQYTRPKISKSTICSSRSTDLIKNYFFINDENVNIDTCLAYTEKDNILDGYEDKYSDEVIHNRTKLFENLNIFEKKIMEKKRRIYLDTGNAKRPTETIVFTDGLSFSCGSIFVRGLQVHGAAIIAGYNIRPDLINANVDASQSNSPVETFERDESIKHLRNLGFSPRVTFGEHFDFNEEKTPKIPMEFKIYPVDTVVDIYKQYNDDIYDRFIKEAEKIFAKYNKLDGECNQIILIYIMKQVNVIPN